MEREFTTPVSMPVPEDKFLYLKGELESLGYTVFTRMNFPFVGTNCGNKQNEAIQLRKYEIDDHGRTLIDQYNPDMFLALASMSKGNKFYPGEYVRIDKNKELFKVKGVDNCGNVTLLKDERSTYIIPVNYLVKAGKDEIIKWFTPNKSDECTVSGEIEPSVMLADIDKPPLGIMPRKLWEEQRIGGLMEAINRHLKVGRSLPAEWVDELWSLLCDRIKSE